MKLPQKLDDTFEHGINGGVYPSEVKLKINEIIAYLDEQHEQQKPCEICNDNEIFTCIECGRKAIRDAYGKPISKELCIKGGNFGCTCENCTKHFMERLNRIFSPNTQ